MADYSIFTGVSGPSSNAGDPAAEVNLGHIFRLSSICWVKSIRFWRGATSINGTQKGRVFAVASQTVVSGTAVDFPALSGTGWQVATLPTPVQLAANTTYKVVVHFTDNYSATSAYWSSGAGVGGRTDGPLTAPDAGGTPLGLGSIKQGSYGYSSNADAYPDSYFNGGNYWVDLVVTDVDPSTHPPGTGTAALTLAAAGVGGKRITDARSAPLALDASGTGIARRVGTGAAAIQLAGSGVGTARRVGTGTAPLALSASGLQAGAATMRPATRTAAQANPANRGGTTITGV